jgi:distribution and morphology protein 34
MTGSHGMLAAKHALVVPMLLRLSHFRLSSYVVLVVSKQKGITLVFKTDPLQNVDINSTFDSIAVIQSFIQREIEGQLRQMFREDLPGIIHRLSQQWVNAKVEAPYLAKFPPSALSPELVTHMVMSAPNLRTLHRPNAGPPSVASIANGVHPFYPRGRTSSGPSIAGTVQSRTRRPKSPEPAHAPDPPDSTFPEIENFDPTYGLRPEGLPTKSAFRSFGRLFSKPGRGLADLAEECTDEDDEDAGNESTLYDMTDWDDPVPSFSPSDQSVLGDNLAGSSAGIEYETVPAVGGGTVTRPRVYHAHSQVHPRAPLSASLASTSRLTRAALEQLPRADRPRRPHSLYNPYFPPLDMADHFARAPSMRTYRNSFEAPTPPLYRSPPRRAVSPSSLHTHESSSHTQTHSVPTPPSTEALLPAPRERTRRGSTTSMSVSAAGTGADTTDPRIVLRPALHGALSALASLEHSNHTLSPYTRSPSHFTVRSGPRSAPPAQPHAPPRARRRRTHFLGAVAAAAKATKAHAEEVGDWGSGEGRDMSPPRSEFDAEDMDRYFRMRDELASAAGAGPASEPVPDLGDASFLGYGIRRGRGYARAPARFPTHHAHHDRLPEGVDAKTHTRRRHAYSQHE